MFWCVNIFFLFYYGLGYFRFRDGIYSVYPISRKKKRKGFENYWWFESHFQNAAIGNVYYVNKIFFLAWCFVACITLVFGFVSFMKPIIMVLIGLLGVFLIPMHLWGMGKSNQKEYGTSIVVCQRIKEIKGRKVYSSIPEIILACVAPLFFVLFDLVIMGVI